MRNIKTTLALLFAYALATFLPAPGLWLRGLRLGAESVHPPQILLALLLLTAGISTSRDALRRVLFFRYQMLLMLTLSWIAPAMSAMVIAFGVWCLGCPGSVALGIVIVSAMPIANSSVGWSTLLGGHVAMSIAILVCSTALSPLLTPLLVSLGSQEIGAAEAALRSTPWSEGMGQFFFVWVLLPVFAGVLVAGRLTRVQSKQLTPSLKRLSFGILVLLNYLNGAACLPRLAEQPEMLFWPAVAALALLGLSFGACQFFKWLSNKFSIIPRLSSANQNSLTLAVVMRNTGAALVFAGEALPTFALVSITIVTYTLVQHLGVGVLLVPRSAMRRARRLDKQADVAHDREAALE